MNQPGRFGPFLLFQQTESTSYRSCYRAGVARGRAVERIVRLEVFDQAGFDPTELLIRLEPSAALQARLQDPHIANGAGLGQVEATPWVAYDFELGTTLTSFLDAARERAFPVPLDQALFITERVALALSAAYRVDDSGGPVLHSFLTPDAVLLSNVGEIKVSGFETGRALRQRLAGEAFCAPYLSSESRDGQPASAQDDVFSLASILFELVTGRAPAAQSSSFEADGLTQTNGEPVPKELQALFQNSFAPPTHRIPDVQEWQRSLSKLILDGEYNPTTFNLAFLMHTLLREPLERGVESLERERRFVLPASGEAAAPGDQTVETATEPSISASESGTSQRSSKDEALEMPLLTPTPAASSVDPRPFWLGFSISALTASAVLVAALLLAGGTERAPAQPLASGARAGLVPDSGSTDGPTAAQSALEAGAAAAPVPALVLTEVVEGQVGRPLDNVEVQEMVAARAAEIERSLAAEYEKKLAALRDEMLALRESGGPDREEGALEQASDRSRASEPIEDPDRSSDGGVNTAAASLEVAGGLPQENLYENSAAVESVAGEVEPSTDQTGGVPTQIADLPPEPVRAHPSPPRVDTPKQVEKTPAIGKPQPAVSPVETGTTVPDIAPARLLRLNPPAYPPAAKRFGLSATARVQVVISAKGKVKKAEILGPELGSGFDRAALAAAHRSTWQPATRNGEPVDSSSVLTVEFHP